MGEYPEIRSLYIRHLQKLEEKNTGVLYGVSVGPGDPELITLKAVRLIKECPVLAVPRTRGENTLALSIVMQTADIRGKEIVYTDFPMTRDKEILAKNYERIAELLAEYLEQGKNVAMLTIGDISIYSTFSYVGERAAQAGCVVATEYHADTLTDTLASALALLGEAPGLRTLWQPPVGLTAAENLHALHALEGRVENLHVYHRDREGACRPLAEGTADWHAYFAAAQKDGTQRYATLEFVMGDNEEQFLQDAAALHVLLKEE